MAQNWNFNLEFKFEFFSVSSIIIYIDWRKWANTHFKKTIQHFAPFPKIIRKCPSFETRFYQNRVIKKII